MWGKDNGKSGVYEFSKEQIEKNFLAVHTYEAWIIKQEESNTEEEDKKNKKEETNEKETLLKDENLTNELKQKEDFCIDKEPETKRKLDESLNSEDENKNETLNKKAKTVSNVLIIKSVEQEQGKLVKFNPELTIKDEECFECQQVYRDPSRSDLTMYLHALSYKVIQKYFLKSFTKLNFLLLLFFSLVIW